MKRTKEQLIKAQQELDAKGLGPKLLDDPVEYAARGDMAAAVYNLAMQAGWRWREHILATFPLCGVDEQGHLLKPGCIPTRYGAVGDEGDTVFWKAGEHMDAVLRRGVDMVTERVLNSLAASGGRDRSKFGKAASHTRHTVPGTSQGPMEISYGARTFVFDGKAIDQASRILEQAGKAGKGMDEIQDQLMKLATMVRSGTPVRKEVPRTHREFCDALGLEEGVDYTELRKNIAEWLSLPFTEEQARLQEEANRRIVTQRCRRCPDPADEHTCRCGRTSAKSDGFLSVNGWECANCKALDAVGALQSIAKMLDLPAGGEAVKVVPDAVRRALGGSPRSVRDVLSTLSFQGPHYKPPFSNIGATGYVGISAKEIYASAIAAGGSVLKCRCGVKIITDLPGVGPAKCPSCGDGLARVELPEVESSGVVVLGCRCGTKFAAGMSAIGTVKCPSCGCGQVGVG